MQTTIGAGIMNLDDTLGAIALAMIGAMMILMMAMY
jgi:hypothetical protein